MGGVFRVPRWRRAPDARLVPWQNWSDVKALEALVHSGVQPVRVVLRALALLASDSGYSAPTVAVAVRLSPQTVRNVAQRYRHHGLAGAPYERPRPGAAEVLAAAEQQRIIAMVCVSSRGGIDVVSRLSSPSHPSRAVARAP